MRLWDVRVCTQTAAFSRVLSGALAATLLVGSVALTGCEMSRTSYSGNVEIAARDYPSYAEQDLTEKDFDAVDELDLSLAHVGADMASRMKEENTVFSPFGVVNTLGLIQPGASEGTALEISQYLGTDMPNEQLMGGMAHLLKDIHESKELQHAALMVHASQSDLATPYKSFVETYSDAEIFKFDFTKDNDLHLKLNAFSAKKTHDLITDPFTEPLDKDLKLLLLDILAFHGEWSLPFEESATEPDTFHAQLPDGTQKKVEVPFMNRYFEEDVTYVNNDVFEAVSLPFKGQSSMVFILPANGVSAKQALHDALLERPWDGEMVGSEGEVSLPKFDIMQEIDLKELTQQAGLTSLYDPKLAPLDKLFDPPTNDYVDFYKQIARIQVDEKGAKAAAVTMMGVKETAMMIEDEPFELTFDKPFGYVILNNGMPLFAGTVYSFEDAK